MKPKSCKYIDGTSCKCVERGSTSLKSYNKVESLKEELLKLSVNSPEYQQLLEEISIVKGKWFVNSPAHNFCFWAWFRDIKEEPKTLAECAQALNLSISQVANIERKALDKLRNYVKGNPEFKEAFFYLTSKSDFNHLD